MCHLLKPLLGVHEENLAYNALIMRFTDTDVFIQLAHYSHKVRHFMVLNFYLTPWRHGNIV